MPGFLTASMFLSNIINTRLKPINCEEVGAVSVIVCARNEEHTIYKTIERIVMQEYNALIHIFCIDNGSTDHTPQEMKRAMQTLSRENREIELIPCFSPGKSRALNAGLAQINTRYFLTVDADTLLESNAVCAILSRISHEQAGCVAGNLLVEQPQTLIQKMQIYDYLISIAAIKRYQGSYNATLVAQGAFSAYDTVAVKELGGWTHDAGEDIVLTYRLLAMGYKSLYEPQAIGRTVVPATLSGLWRQRVRWAEGMFEGFAAVRSWAQASFSGGYFEAINLSIVNLDLAYIFGFLVGVILMIFSLDWFVELKLLLLLQLPLVVVFSISIYLFQRRVSGKIKHSIVGLIFFLLFYQTIQSICSLVGYSRMLLRRHIVWKE